MTKREIILIIALAATFISSLLIYRNQENEITDREFKLGYYTDSLKTYKTKSGKDAARISTLEGEIKTIRIVLGDSLAAMEKELGIKSKRITDLINTTLVSDISVNERLDSTRSLTLEKRWYNLSFSCLSDSIKGRIQVFDSITYVRHKYGKWYQKKYLVMDGLSHSPHTRITGIKDIKVRDNPNKMTLVIGTGAGMGIDGIRWNYLQLTFGFKLLER